MGSEYNYREIWDCASDVTGLDLRRLCQKGPMNRLVKTTTQQAAVTAINVTLYSLYAEQFSDANVIGSCGHSVGEYSALYAAGALTLENVFKLILARSTIMDDLSNIHKGAMLAVRGADFQMVSQLINDSGSQVVVSCDNSPYQQVVGGTLPDLSEFTGRLMGLAEAIKLGVSGPGIHLLCLRGSTHAGCAEDGGNSPAKSSCTDECHRV